jgi:tight adherence protein C
MDLSVPQAWFYAATSALSLSIACVAFALARGAVVPEPRLGLRGLKRQKAMRKKGNFYRVEPAVRKIGGWTSALELGGLRRKTDQLLLSAGDYLGLSADELFAMVILGACGGALAGAAAVILVGVDPVLIPVFALGAAYLMVADVRSAADVRRRDVSRALPSAIDLIALCMSAGLDFAGALVQIVKNAPLEDDPLIEELGLILYHLQLGHSRSRALQVFGARVPTESVSDFVFAVIQAEAKGNPLAETLRTQATVLRTRRSVRAEELAAKAANKMLIPMTLLVASALFLILGPMLVKMLGSGVF